jgi:hypothetical protein
MNVDEIFTSKYLKASDLQGKEVTVTIAKVGVESLNDGERKPSLHFVGKDKGMLLNKTNTNRIATMYGKEMNEWVGKKVTLAAEWVDFKGETVEAVRVQMRGRPGAPPDAPPAHMPPPPQSPADYGSLDDEIPF